MKRTIVCLMLIGSCLFGEELKFKDLTYLYSFPDDACEETDFDMKQGVIKNVNSSIYLLEEIVNINSYDRYVKIQGKNRNGVVKVLVMANTLQACEYAKKIYSKN